MRKSYRFTEFRSGKVLERLSSPLSSSTLAGPAGLDLRKDSFTVTKPGVKVPKGGSFFSFLLFQRATSGLSQKASLAALGAQDLGTSGAGCGLSS